MNLQDTSTKVLLVGVVILVGLLIAGAVFWSSQPATAPTPTTVDATKVTSEGNPFIGKASAPVTMTEFSDYQCPACKQFELVTLPQILTAYVDTGKVKIVFKDYPFLGNDSITGGEYARSIWKLYPDQYFTWRTAMYNAQDQEGDQGFGNAASIDKLDATITGIDAAKVAADVKANASAYQALMDADKTEATALGVNATPSFIIGTKLLTGSFPFANYQSVIDPLLK
jgi:protein-disulfide isomerase